MRDEDGERERAREGREGEREREEGREEKRERKGGTGERRIKNGFESAKNLGRVDGKGKEEGREKE